MNKFEGETTAEAANCLCRFVRDLAKELDVPLQMEPLAALQVTNQLVAWVGEAPEPNFRIEISFDIEPVVVLKRRINPGASVFGWGKISKCGAVIALELKYDSDRLFRWYGVPREITDAVRAIIPSLKPFVLTHEYIADGFSVLTTR